MRKDFIVVGLIAGAFSITGAILSQEVSSASSTPTPTPQTIDAAAVSPTPPLVSPTPVPDVTPLPSATPYTPSEAVVSASTFDYSEAGAPVFTEDKAVLLALRQNPQVLNALQEIQRSKGVIIQVRAEALPVVNAAARLDHTQSSLNQSNFNNVGGVTPTPAAVAKVVDAPASQIRDTSAQPKATQASSARSASNISETQYNINLIGQQLIFNYSTFRAIRGTFFQRDSAYFAFRNVLDTTIATVKTQFYQVLVNRALIQVQEESVALLDSQLKDQQNRFDAGTVPRFNVLQAQVQLLNQIPNLIAARNNYRISILQLAKTLGIDYNPARGVAAPLRVVGDLVYIPRSIHLVEDIEYGKQNRPFLKEARANVLNQIEQVHVALGGWFPMINMSGGWEVQSNPFTTSIDRAAEGWVFGLTGNWNIWDSGLVYGQVKQQRALLSESKITYDDDVRQVELEIQQAASNLLQNRELIQSTEKNVELADEAVRLAKARLDAGAGTQLDVLNAQVQLTTAQSVRLEALFGWVSSLAEFDRVTGRQSTYTEQFADIAPRATKTRTYYTGSDVNSTGDPKRSALRPGPVTTTTTRTTTTTPGK